MRGLLADLAEDEPEVAEMLALDVPRDTSAEHHRRSSDRGYEGHNGRGDNRHRHHGN